MLRWFNTSILFAVVFSISSCVLSPKTEEEKEYETLGKAMSDYQSIMKKIDESDKREKQEISDRAQRLNKLVSISILGKENLQGRYKVDSIGFPVQFINNSDKDIRAIKGSIYITDLFDEKVKEFEITCESVIPVGHYLPYYYKTEYKDYYESEKKLGTKDFADLKFYWLPSKIVFADGSSAQ